MAARAVSRDVKLKEAISGLKRATGIRSATTEEDAFRNGCCRVYTTDLESAQILANLISQALMATDRHTERFWANKIIPDIGGPHFGLDIEERGEHLYRINFTLIHFRFDDFIRKINEKTQLLISPDKPARPRR